MQELWLIYKLRKQPMSRRVAFAGSNKETLFVSLPLPRCQWSVSKRDDYLGAGEDTTYHPTYTGVEEMAVKGLPFLPRKSKHELLGRSGEATAPTRWKRAGVPLFWQERRTARCWQVLMKDLNVSAVVDLTPGSGTFARACLQMDKPYIGVCQNEHHKGWLGNLLDRQVARLVCTVGSALHNADMAGQLEEHFSSTIKHLVQSVSDEAQDDEEEDELDDDAPNA